MASQGCIPDEPVECGVGTPAEQSREPIEQMVRAVGTPASAGACGSIVFNIINKNVYFIQTEHRLDELIAELELFEWDVVLSTETWRADKEEVMVLASGHLLIASGGTVGERGVAAIIHNRWKGG